LRVLELIFSGKISRDADGPAEDQNRNQPIKSRRNKKRHKKEAAGDEKKIDKTRSSSGTGAVSTLMSVYQTDFFKKPRTIGDILVHCETNLARKIKANEISGKLGRMVRNGELKRTKNADGQYEYTTSKGAA